MFRNIISSWAVYHERARVCAPSVTLRSSRSEEQARGGVIILWLKKDTRFESQWGHGTSHSAESTHSLECVTHSWRHSQVDGRAVSAWLFNIQSGDARKPYIRCDVCSEGQREESYFFVLYKLLTSLFLIVGYITPPCGPTSLSHSLSSCVSPVFFISRVFHVSTPLSLLALSFWPSSFLPPASPLRRHLKK